MRRASASFLVFSAVLALSACAGKPPPQPLAPQPEKAFQALSVRTPGVSGAACRIDTPAGTYTLITPGHVTVERTPWPMNIACGKGDHFGGQAVIEPRQIGDPDSAEGYIYPFGVTVSMGLRDGSLEKALKVY